MRRFGLNGLAGCAALLLGMVCAKADTSIELPIGGLVFTGATGVAMEAQELKINAQTVAIRYRLLNQSAQPVTLTMAFPLPDIDMTDPDVLYAIPGNDPVNFVGFETKVDGQPVRFEMRQRAMLGDKDVTDKVRAAGLALLPMGHQQEAVDALAQQTRDKLVADGLLLPNGTDQDGKTQYSGPWTVKTSASRQQVFPPGKAVVIDHTYRTSVGISFDTVLRKAVRETQAMEAEFKRYMAEYCIPDGLLRGIDRVAGPAPANVVKLQERRISYALKSTAGATGPIKDFHLIIDKGRPDYLISFCIEGVKKIAPTAFEFRAKDYTPDRDLKILLITKPDGKVPIAKPDAPLLKQTPGRPERFD